MKKIGTFLVLAAACLPFAATGATVTLNATVRDFLDGSKVGGHPDFETYNGAASGLVGTTLGLDGNPVFTGTPGGKITSAATFAQWYETVPGVNVETTIPLPLSDDSTPGIYRFSSNSFFPIDNQLLGNEGRTHNYHFTLELHTTFAYAPGQTFSFTGDDDVWVFINNQRVVDLGGVHGPATGSVNLDTLGLTAGNNYDFAMFFAERHTSQSNFTIETAIQFVPEPSVTTLVAGAVAFGLLSRRRSRR